MVRRDSLIIRNLMVYYYKFLNPETNEEFIFTDCEELTLKQATKMAHEKGLLFIGCSTRTERRVMSKKFFFDNSSVSNAGKYYK